VNLNLQDALALLYTGSGSQRAIARTLGISHQKVGRILRTGQEGGFKPNSRALADPGLIAVVNRALSDHSKAAAAVAASQGLPFDPRYPVLSQRMAFREPGRTHVLGDRVEALHTHWLSNALREAWLKAMHRSGRFYNVSAGSIVNLIVYGKRADIDARGKLRTQNQLAAKANIKRQIKANMAQGIIQTPYIIFTKGALPVQYLLSELNDRLNEKHKSATGEDMPGTAFATRFLFQIDTRAGKDDKFRKAHPIPARGSSPAKTTAPKHSKARGSTGSAKRKR